MHATIHLSKNRYVRILFLVCCLCRLCSVGRAQVTVYRDPFGLPSVAASKLPDAIYGLGYAMARDNAESMARNYKQARGRLAEVDGKGQLFTDGFLRSLGIEASAAKKAAALTGEPAILLDRFCAGANRGLLEERGHIPTWIKPFTRTDVLALAQLANAAFPLQDVASKMLPGLGSNQFAVGKQRSATGHAILSADPHLLWSGPLLWYEYSLYSQGVNLHGVTLNGLPFPVMGHTDHIAWCMTNNNPSLYALYTVKTDADHPGQYNYHGEWRKFEEEKVTLSYLDPDGSNGEQKTQEQTVRRTAWGPMAPIGALAVDLSMIGEWDQLEESLKMVRARDVQEFRTALQARGLSMWNIVCADTKGNISYQYNARLPRRDPSFDWSKPVPGDDPRTKWGELWSLDELPHVTNPKSNLLINANSTPWLTPQDDEIPQNAWPAYVTSYGRTTRYDRLAQLLNAEPKLTLERAQQIATDTEVPYALKAIAALSVAVSSYAPGAENMDTIRAAGLLKEWNGRADIDARGCALYMQWLLADRGNTALAIKASQGTAWSESEARSAVKALTLAAEKATTLYGRLDIPWGEVHFSKRGQATIPVSGLGYFQPNDSTATVAPNFGTLRNGKIQCTGGSSFRMIVDLDPKGVHSWSILPYGDSQTPGTPHYADQADRFGRGEYKETYFGLKQILKAATSKQELKMQ